MRIRDHMFELTPLGKADKEVRDFLEERLAEHQVESYKASLNHYRALKVVQSALKTLLYAGLITSVAATVGLEKPAGVIRAVASYLGTSLIFLLFIGVSYVTMIRRENYHVQREILIAEAAARDLSD